MGDATLCVTASERGAVLDPKGFDDLYAAAACLAVAGDVDKAFHALDGAIDRGYFDALLVANDSDFASLTKDPRWAIAMQRIRSNLTAHLAHVNPELYQLVTEDQKARMGDFMAGDINEFAAHDAARLLRVKEILAAHGARVADDYYNAALVAQHGQTVDDYHLAQTLARQAATLDPTNAQAIWLAAAATDRELVHAGKPQHFGTQSHGGSDGIMTTDATDPSVTDEERARWFVRSIADQKRLLDAMNAAQLKMNARRTP